MKTVILCGKIDFMVIYLHVTKIIYLYFIIFFTTISWAKTYYINHFGLDEASSKKCSVPVISFILLLILKVNPIITKLVSTIKLQELWAKNEN